MSGTRVHRLSIVGGGPRATYALERLSADIGRLGDDDGLQLRIFERSGEFGSGAVHSPTQPTTSYLNRITGQVAFAADETVGGAGPLRPAPRRPTLHDWCRDRFARTGHPDFDLGPGDWPKRYVHGMALRDMFDSYLADLRAHPRVEVHLHHGDVVDIERRGELVVRVADGQGFGADQVLLVTGHSRLEPTLCDRTRAVAAFAERAGRTHVSNAYPLDTMLPAGATGPDRVVGIDGMGLTAIDVILFLTEGRGGRFVADAEHGLRYLPSGAEPAKLVAFSDTGLFTFARPNNAKEAAPDELVHRGTFLTPDAVDQLRRRVGRPRRGDGPRQLDFERDVLPLVVLEMASVHYSTLFGRWAGEFVNGRVRDLYGSFLAGGPAHRGRPDDPTRLLGPVEAAVDELVAALTAIVEGRMPLAAAQSRWPRMPVSAAMRRWVKVVFGADVAVPHDDPGALRRAIESATSPWRLASAPADNRFDWERTVAPLAAQRWTPDGYRCAVLDFMATDRRWAMQGNLDNPHKAAADGVWRDLRAVLSYAADDGGLTAASQRVFLGRYVRVHNRLANGASLHVMARLEALIRHGLLDVSGGPGAKVVPDRGTGRFRVDGPATGVSHLVHTLVDARVHPFDPRYDVSPLFRNLLRTGLVRLWRNESPAGDAFVPGGLDLTDRFHPVCADGTVDERVTVLGVPGEGRKSFLFSALRPGCDHYVMRETLTWLADFWRQVQTSTAHGNAAVPCPAHPAQECTCTA